MPNYNQSYLDDANAAYHKVALEENDYQYADADDIYQALMLAWMFIDDVTEGKYV